MSWLTDYCAAAEQTDQLVGSTNHTKLLSSGLAGEVGSVLAELKKVRREADAYPAYQAKLTEEIGDTLWYLVRLIAVLSPTTFAHLDTRAIPVTDRNALYLNDALALGAATGRVLDALHQEEGSVLAMELLGIWSTLHRIAVGAGIDLQESAHLNLLKIRSRWPEIREFHPLFDGEYSEEEQLPRKLDIEFRQVYSGERKIVLLRCNGLNFGDRLTDNIEHPDFYRYHDIFHFSYAVYLGWSPVIRKLLSCKRKSDSDVDENQDGARAGIIDEAVSAIVFSRAKELNFYNGIDHVDYDLLKTIKEFVRGFEVERIPLWQWEVAILEGYRVFRSLSCHGGGKVTMDLVKRELRYVASPLNRAS